MSQMSEKFFSCKEEQYFFPLKLSDSSERKKQKVFPIFEPMTSGTKRAHQTLSSQDVRGANFEYETKKGVNTAFPNNFSLFLLLVSI